MIPRCSALDLSRLYPIRTCYTLAGVQGYAIHVFNQHSNTWQPIGAIHTGAGAFTAVYESRLELLEDLAEQS